MNHGPWSISNPWALERNKALILCQPLIERLELRIQLPRHVSAACVKNLFFEVTVDLKHVPHFVGALKSEAAKRVRFNGVVLHRADCKALREFLTDFVEREVLTRYADSPADVLLARLEDPIGDL